MSTKVLLQQSDLPLKINILSWLEDTRTLKQNTLAYTCTTYRALRTFEK